MSVTNLKQHLFTFKEFWVVLIALLVAWTLAAHQNAYYSLFGVVGSYVYWTCRILIEAAFFMAALLPIEKYFKQLLEPWLCCAVAIALSLIPFTLAITALDLILGLPELGLNNPDETTHARGWAFGLELFYLLDNHMLLSILLLIPRVLLQSNHSSLLAASPESDKLKHTFRQKTFFDTLEPLLEGSVYSMEAQEHYILIKGDHADRLVLHRFSDAIKQTPSELGMQVHRSHWVAHTAIKDVVIEGQAMKLTLIDGKTVPVSRSFRNMVDNLLKQQST